MTRKKRRIDELEKLIGSVYEDKVAGKIPEEVCIRLIEKYTTEQRELKTALDRQEQELSSSREACADVEEFISRIKKYLEVKELTREMCVELIDRIIVGGFPRATNQPQRIEIVYKVDINTIRQSPRLLIKNLIQKIVVYDDRFEIYYNYLNRMPPKTDDIGDKSIAETPPNTCSDISKDSSPIKNTGNRLCFLLVAPSGAADLLGDCRAHTVAVFSVL